MRTLFPVVCRDDKQLALVLHTLYNALPDDCVFGATNGRQDLIEYFKQLVNKGMDEEIKLFNSHFKENINFNSIGFNNLSERSKCAIQAEDLQRVREQFAFKQSCVFLHGNVSSNHGKNQCSNFVQTFCEKMEYTDWAIENLHRLTS